MVIGVFTWLLVGRHPIPPRAQSVAIPRRVVPAKFTGFPCIADGWMFATGRMSSGAVSGPTACLRNRE